MGPRRQPNATLGSLPVTWMWPNPRFWPVSRTHLAFTTWTRIWMRSTPASVPCWMRWSFMADAVEEADPRDLIARALRTVLQQTGASVAGFLSLDPNDLLPKLVDDSAMRKGLKVTTTLDLGLQKTAEQDVSDRLASLPRGMGPLEGALVAIDPRNAQILAMVGGHSFFDDPVHGQINYALAPNSPGSAMKPITYLAAFEKGWSPATILPDQPIQLNNGVRPYTLQNFDGKYSGRVSARDALGNSLNVPAVWTANR